METYVGVLDEVDYFIRFSIFELCREFMSETVCFQTMFAAVYMSVANFEIEMVIGSFMKNNK